MLEVYYVVVCDVVNLRVFANGCIMRNCTTVIDLRLRMNNLHVGIFRLLQLNLLFPCNMAAWLCDVASPHARREEGASRRSTAVGEDTVDRDESALATSYTAIHVHVWPIVCGPSAATHFCRRITRRTNLLIRRQFLTGDPTPRRARQNRIISQASAALLRR